MEQSLETVRRNIGRRLYYMLPSIWDHGGQVRSQKRSRPTEREVNTAVFMLRAKQLGFSLEELDSVEEGLVMDMIIESGNDLCDDEYCQMATQADFDAW
jgi:hypothetical protein